MENNIETVEDEGKLGKTKLQQTKVEVEISKKEAQKMVNSALANYQKKKWSF